MWYIGSKRRVAKELAPIIHSFIQKDTAAYIEPFVGGANMITEIVHPYRVGVDIHPQLIALLKQAQEDSTVFPKEITFEEHEYVKNHQKEFPQWYVGMVGFLSSFGAKYFGSYARSQRGSNDTKKSREAINGLKKQAPKLKDILFLCGDYQEKVSRSLKKCVLYCDPPYRGTAKYVGQSIEYESFFSWVRAMSVKNTVLISEYQMPPDFTCIWEKEILVGINNYSGKTKEEKRRIERLFQYAG